MDNYETDQKPQQPVYAESSPPQHDPDKAVMTMGEWLITLIIIVIPCVNIIMLFVWAFGSGNENRKNFSRAQLIIYAIGIVLSLIFYSSLFAFLMSFANNY